MEAIMAEVEPDSQATRALLERIGRGDRTALERLLTRYRPRLHAFIEVRLDPRLRARVDPSDVVQETQLEVVRRIDSFLRRQTMPFHLWVRKTAYERLLDLRRNHCRRARRSVDREIPWPERSSLLLARPLLAGGPSPSQQLAARELAERVAQAVAELGEDDREILLMRHAEELSYDAIACLLEIEAATARKRYGRALFRLQQVLSQHGLLEE
jgi:RNA polymerase sigma-70 factor (ECF subfamily)